MEEKMLTIHETAEKLGVSIDTLRRWDKEGKFTAIRKSASGHRYYREIDVELYATDIFNIAKEWVSSAKPAYPAEQYYCQYGSEFQTRLIKLEKRLQEAVALKDIFPLIVAVCGEIGNNSFDHNLGNWPDAPGVFFAYDVNKGCVVLADRGQGIFKTLQRVKPEIKNDQDALYIAFSEIISGRAPESRGNGLKFVKQVIVKNKFSLFFQTGDAELRLSMGDEALKIEKSFKKINGCLALIKFK